MLVRWNHPDIPWTGSMLYVTNWDNKIVGTLVTIAGKPGSESIIQHRWGLDGTLFCSSDSSGYYQLHHLDGGESQAQKINLKGLEEAEFASLSFRLGAWVFLSRME